MKNQSNVVRIGDNLPKGRKSLAKAASQLPHEKAQATDEQKAAMLEWFGDFFIGVMASVSAGQMLRRDPPMEKATRKAWLSAFLESEIRSKEQVYSGLEKLRKQSRQWMPSAHEFLELCQPDMADYGMPDLETAYREALQNAPRRRMGETVEWSHETVRVACGRSSMELCEGTEQRAKAAFTREYKHAFELVKAGKLAGDARALPKKKVDPNFAHYQRLLKNHGPAIAADFLTDCAKNGVVIQENGNVTYEDVDKTVPTSAASILESLGVVKTQVGECPAGDLPGYKLPDNDRVRKNREAAHYLLELEASQGGAA